MDTMSVAFLVILGVWSMLSILAQFSFLVFYRDISGNSVRCQYLPTLSGYPFKVADALLRVC
jgi:hypothetical protein